MKSIFIAVLLLTVNAFGAVRIPSEELVLALERGKVLTDYELDQEQSRATAYTTFNEYIDGKLGQVGQGAVFTACPEDKKQKISRFVRTLLNFVGWSSHSKALLDESGKTYNQYLNLIDVISPYETSDSAKNNLKIAKARLQRLALESQMREEGQTYEQYEQAHPGALSRQGIYNLLAEVTQGVKVRLIEKADLIVTCGYSPTGNLATDLDLAEEFMDQYSQVKHHGYFHRQHPRAGAARKRTATAVPYLSIKGSEVSGEISNRAHDISARIAMLRNALPVNGGGAGNGGDGDSDNDGDGDNDNDGENGRGNGFGGGGNGLSFPSAVASTAMQVEAPQHGLSTSSTSASSIITSCSFSSSSAAAASADMQTEEYYVASSSFLTPTASDDQDDQGGSDNDDGFGGSDNGFGFASGGASAASDIDFPPRKTGQKRKIISDDEEDNQESSDEEKISHSPKKVGRPVDPQTEATFNRIRAALEADKSLANLSAPKIARAVGVGVTADDVYRFLNKYAPDLKRRPQMTEAVVAENNEKVRLAYEQFPGKSHADLAKIAGVNKKFVDAWFLKNGLTTAKTTPQQKQQNNGIIAGLIRMHPQATARQIADFAVAQGDSHITIPMVHKYKETRPDLKQPKPKTTPLTAAQKDQIIELRKAGEEFNAIAAVVGCTFAQAYKYYNKDRK